MSGEITVRTPEQLGAAVRAFLEQLPRRLGRRAVVLVPGEALAHELRRKLMAGSDGPALLCGVHFTRADALALELCARAGQVRTFGLERAWPAALDCLIQAGDLRLEYFPLDHLRAHATYPEALARSLLELERAGLEADALAGLAERTEPPARGRLLDLVALRRAVDGFFLEEQRRSVTTPAGLRLAAGCLQAAPRLGTGLGPVCAVGVGSTRPEHRPLLRSLRAYEVRLEGDLECLSPDELHVARHGGALDELEALAAFAEREVARGTALGRIGVVCARSDLILPAARRLARFAGVFEAELLAEGLPVGATDGGALLGLMIAAVEEHLPRSALSELLARFDPSLTPSAAVARVFALGVLGGQPQSHRDLNRSLERAEGLSEAGRTGLSRLAALAALTEADAAFDRVAGALGDLIGLLPESGAREALHARLEDAGLAFRPLGERLRGGRALRHIAAALQGARLPRARFGRPLPFVGPAEALAGLSFEALALIGLSEGSVPAAPHDDPVLPDFVRLALRAELPPTVREQLPLSGEIVARSRAAVDACAVSARRLWASAATQQLDLQQLEPSTYLLELHARGPSRFETLEAALARGRDEALALLSRRPTHLARQALRLADGPRARLDDGLVAPIAVPGSWLGGPAALGPILASRAALLEPCIGIWEGVSGPEVVPPGLAPERGLPITALVTLLGCPRRFAHEVLLGERTPAVFPPAHELDRALRGTALHRAVERFFNDCGQAFLASAERALFRDEAIALAGHVFDEIAAAYVFEGALLRARERTGLAELMAALIGYYSRRPELSRFVAAERSVGATSAACMTPTGPLHLRGKIDLVFAHPGGLAIHDVKSGRVALRSERDEFEIERDLQPLAYDACLSETGQGVVSEVALVFPAGGAEAVDRRLWGSALTDGRSWARELFYIARRLLAARAFVPLPSGPELCAMCQFACDPEAIEAVQRKVAAAGENGPRTETERALVDLWRKRRSEGSDDE